jgi:hypothetical protein
MSRRDFAGVGALVIAILILAGLVFGGGGRMLNGLVADGVVIEKSAPAYQINQTTGSQRIDQTVLSWFGFGTVEQCRPTLDNPRYKCVPAGLNGAGNPAVNICQLGGCLPDEWKGLPAGGGR